MKEQTFKVGDIVRLKGCSSEQTVTSVRVTHNQRISTKYRKSFNRYRSRNANDFELVDRPGDDPTVPCDTCPGAVNTTSLVGQKVRVTANTGMQVPVWYKVIQEFVYHGEDYLLVESNTGSQPWSKKLKEFTQEPNRYLTLLETVGPNNTLTIVRVSRERIPSGKLFVVKGIVYRVVKSEGSINIDGYSEFIGWEVSNIVTK